MTDTELLRRYATDGPDAHDAFAALVRVHAGWVYSVARRRVRDRELAEDVAQAAFIVLAQKGKRLPPGTPLAPWLFRVTNFAASRALRDESRRRRHEARAAAERPMTMTPSGGRDNNDDAMQWDELAPVLDQAVESLASNDRRAVLLRFYQQLPLAEVGRTLGISEEAARKRVSRAVERLRHRLTSLGVRAAQVAPAAGLAALLLERTTDAAVAAAHASRWAAVSVTAEGAGAASGASTTSTELAKGALKMILWNHTKAAVAAVMTMAVVLAGVAAAVQAVVAPPSPQRRAVAVAAPAKPPAVLTIESQNLLIAVSPDGREVAGFSMTIGQWQPMPQPPDSAASVAIDTGNIVVSENVGIYRDAQRAYGFSGITGKWDSVAVNPPEDPASDIVVAQNVGACPDANRIHAFSALTGTWDTLTLPAGDGAEPPQPVPVVSQITVRIVHQKSFYLFSAKTGKWTEPPFQEKE